MGVQVYWVLFFKTDNKKFYGGASIVQCMYGTISTLLYTIDTTYYVESRILRIDTLKQILHTRSMLATYVHRLSYMRSHTNLDVPVHQVIGNHTHEVHNPSHHYFQHKLSS